MDSALERGGASSCQQGKATLCLPPLEASERKTTSKWFTEMHAALGTAGIVLGVSKSQVTGLQVS